ncbi:LAME_0F14378g1_1 [Lachancea meyersii CBS 8951]|uniref:LAME_0F14378g1_1 n=1 Tax=Lachancea meyersii CBS 8951 TaxID=1266667 RepID=A0A1G4JY01_9SACH|nr:LAME_0F14378g1_1 [Lachancea meyersii CBS 8951]
MTQDSRNVLIHRARFADFKGANITALAFSHASKSDKRTPSDLRLALGRSNGDIEIWNPRNGWCQELTIQGGKDRTVEGLVWSNLPGEPLRLFSIGASTVVTEWDLSSGLALKNYDCNAGVIWSLALNSAQTQLAVGCDNGCVVLINISGGPGVMEHEAVLQRQDSRVLSVTWKGSDYVIGGCADGRIRIWRASNSEEMRGRIVHTMKVDKSKKESTLVWSVLYLPNKNQIVSGDSTGSVKFWDLQYATLTQTFKSHEADVLCLSTDETNTKVFSAGVDRKIYQYNLSAVSAAKKTYKWIVASNRLLHSNDVRTMTSYQSRGADFLVSGGLEKNLIVSSISAFTDSTYTKIPYSAPFHKNALFNSQQRLCVVWQQSCIRIWAISADSSDEKGYKLLCKLSLKDEQNISTCAMSEDGQVLIVGRPSTTKLFHLRPSNGKLKVTKLDNDFLLKTGTKHVKFIDNSKIIMVSSKNEVFYLDLEDEDADEKASEIELPDQPEDISVSKIPHIASINHIECRGSLAVITRICGTMDLINLKNYTAVSVARVTNFITALHLSQRDTALVATADNKLLEFSLKETDESHIGTMSEWCKKNKDFLPKDFGSSKNKYVGIFSDGRSQDRVWLWGSNCLASFDMSQDLPISTRKRPKKHRIDGNTVTDRNSYIDGGEEEDEDDDELESTEPLLKERPTPEQVAKRVTKDSNSFFFTEKYKSMLLVDVLADHELVVIENPGTSRVTSTPAFDLPKLIV